MTQADAGLQIGTPAVPLRVAIIGAGPSGFYAADALLKQTAITVEVDMFDRLPTPYGLVRGGVAPDHQKIKSVTKVYEKIAAHPRFQLYGNVEFGTDVTRDEFKAHYHQIIYAVGAQSDRKLGVPGEDLPGSYAATEFVAWYNAHPDYRHLAFDLDRQKAVVIGNGNVAMDVVRILAASHEELAVTDIADYALEALAKSNITDLYIVGRRGAGQAAFTNPELKELGEMELADIIVLPEDAVIDELSRADLNAHPDPAIEKNLVTLALFAGRTPSGKPRRIHMRFLVSPVEIIAGPDGHVGAIKLVKNVLQAGPDGAIKAKATDQTEILPVDLIFRSIGYTGVPLPGVQFDQRAGVIPNKDGRVFDKANDAIVPGEYAVGWIKRGPSGIIGTNRPDSQATVESMMADVPTLAPIDPANSTRDAVEALLQVRKPSFTTFADWLVLDAYEIEAGLPLGRPRLKLSDVSKMLAIVDQARLAQNEATFETVAAVTQGQDKH